MILTRSSSFDSGSGFEVHIRTTRVNSNHLDYSYISGAALKIGSDTVEVTEDGKLTINGETSELENDELHTYSDLYSISKTRKGSSKRIISYTMDLGDDKNVEIRANQKSHMIFVDVNGAYPDSEGLLGAAPKEGKHLLSRDGTDLTGHWNTYGESWQVNDSDPKLFQIKDRHPQYPAGCSYEAERKKKTYVRGSRRNLLESHTVDLREATVACAHVRDDVIRGYCVDDIMATGDLDLIEDPFYSNPRD